MFILSKYCLTALGIEPLFELSRHFVCFYCSAGLTGSEWRKPGRHGKDNVYTKCDWRQRHGYNRMNNLSSYFVYAFYQFGYETTMPDNFLNYQALLMNNIILLPHQSDRTSFVKLLTVEKLTVKRVGVNR